MTTSPGGSSLVARYECAFSAARRATLAKLSSVSAVGKLFCGHLDEIPALWQGGFKRRFDVWREAVEQSNTNAV